MEEKRVWGIHTMDDFMFLNRNVIAIGWKAMGDLGTLDADREAFKKKYASVYPEAKLQQVANSAGMLYRFVHEAKIGDYIVFPSKVNREINIGVIEGEYLFSPNEAEYVQTRKVKWLKHLPRTSFSQGALYEVGSAMSFFSLKNYADEYLAALEKSGKKVEVVADDAEVVEKTAADIDEEIRSIIAKSYDRCKSILNEHIEKLHFVAEFLLKNESMDEEQFIAAMQMENPTIESIEDIAFRKQQKSDEENDTAHKNNARAEEEERRSFEVVNA